MADPEWIAMAAGAQCKYAVPGMDAVEVHSHMSYATRGCYYSMTTRGGTQGVGRSTTQAVVFSSVLIIAVDFLISQFMINIFGR